MQTLGRNYIIGSTLSLIGLLSIGVTTSVFAQSVLIGGAGDAGSGNSFPLTVNLNGRYQQVYNGALFPSSFSIGSISFFNNNFNPGTAVIDTANYSIHLSTTSKPVNGLDTTVFSNNVGADDAVFFNGVLGGAVGPGNVFTITGNPFLYVPAGGNLLLDITKTGQTGNGTGFLDSRNGTFLTDSSRAHNFGSAFASFGLVTRFNSPTNSTVPEPGSVALLGSMGVTAGLFALKSLRRRR